MNDEESLEMREHRFNCPYCARETVLKSPMDTILMKRTTCEHCGREFLIRNGVPKRSSQ